MEDALQRLDKLTQEEARMAAVENLKATHTVDERVRGVANTVVAIDNNVAEVVHGARIIFSQFLEMFNPNRSRWKGNKASCGSRETFVVFQTYQR